MVNVFRVFFGLKSSRQFVGKSMAASPKEARGQRFNPSSVQTFLSTRALVGSQIV